MHRERYFIFLIVTIALSFAMHSKVMNLDIRGIHTWRQSQTMWNIRNFYRHDANILNPRVSHFNGGYDNIYRYEFPVMQWSIAKLEKVFGEKTTVVRFSLFVIGMFSVLFFYLLLRVLSVSEFSAFGGAVLFQFSPVFSYQIDKMGHIFSNDHLPIGWIDDMINRFKIKYMYSDSRKIDTSAAFQPYIDSLLIQAGSIKVFKLKPKKKY